MSESDLQIEVVKNGFIVYQRNFNKAVSSEKWVFENAESLSDFVLNWGNAVVRDAS